MERKDRTKIKAVLFDLGKVILNFNFKPAFRRLSVACALSAEDIEDYFVQSGLELPYDGGQISSREFYRRVKRALRHSLSFVAFKKIWNEIFTPNRQILRLIRSLKRSGLRLVLISNTNAMHFDYIRRHYPVMKNFSQFVLSFKEKMRKPDARLYRKAIRACRAKAGEIFYIDDRADFTAEAAALGLRVFTFKNNAKALMRVMRQEKIL